MRLIFCGMKIKILKLLTLVMRRICHLSMSQVFVEIQADQVWYVRLYEPGKLFQEKRRLK